MRMKCLLSFGGVITLATFCFGETAPDYLWVRQAGGGPAQQIATGIGVDAQGNIYAAGNFGEKISFGSTNLFGGPLSIAKFDPAGNCLWTRPASVVPFGIAVRPDGTFYLAGYFRGKNSLGNVTLSGSTFFDNAFVAKFNSDGTCLWARAASAESSRARAITLDAAVGVYVSGEFEGPASFGGHTLNSGNSAVMNNAAMFLVKYDGDGTALWAKQSVNGSAVIGQGVAADGSGDVYVVGRFSGTTQFGSMSLSCAGSADIFVAKFNTSGDCLWARRAGGADFDEAHAVASTPNNILLVAGYFRRSAEFGPTNLSGGGGFLASYDSNGNLLWASKIGSGHDDAGWALAPDDAGNIYVAGGFSSWTFGSKKLAASGFIEKLDSSGHTLWNQSAGNESARAVCKDTFGNVFVAGTFWGMNSFGSTNLTRKGDLDVFLGRLARPKEIAQRHLSIWWLVAALVAVMSIIFAWRARKPGADHAR
jgi:hypothetical protein